MGHALLDAAKAIGPELDSRALEGERLRTMPLDLVDKVRRAGLFHIAMPAEVGGGECDAEVILDVVEELSHADGSAGWTIMINNSTAWVAWLEPEVAKQFVGRHPSFISASMFGPTAVARQEGDEFVVDGRWPFNSGSPHADFLINGVMVMDGDAPRLRPDGLPDWRFAVIPRHEAEILDTWHVSGLRGTGSHDVTVAGARVPVELTIAPILDSARLGGPLFKLPFPTLLVVMMSGFPLGVARRAIDEFVALAEKKSRAMGPGAKLIDDEAIHVEVARAEAQLLSARAMVVDMVGRAIDSVSAGDEITMKARAQVTLAGINAGRVARKVVDAMFMHAGGGALYDASPLQRCARDIAAGSAHVFFSQARWKEAGRILMGKEPTTTFI